MTSKMFAVLGSFSAIVTIILQALGGWDVPLQLLAWCMAVDYMTGLAVALIWHKSKKSADGTFESKASIKGLFRKACYIAVVFIAVKLDDATGDGTVFRTATILFFTANDGLSILENLGVMGVPFPDFLKNAFAALKKKANDTPFPAELQTGEEVDPFAAGEAKMLDGEGISICGLHLAPDYLEGFEPHALAALAREMGLETTGAESKAQLIDMLAAEEVKVPFSAVLGVKTVDGE